MLIKHLLEVLGKIHLLLRVGLDEVLYKNASVLMFIFFPIRISKYLLDWLKYAATELSDNLARDINSGRKVFEF